jgi:hypothetical protein
MVIKASEYDSIESPRGATCVCFVSVPRTGRPWQGSDPACVSVRSLAQQRLETAPGNARLGVRRAALDHLANQARIDRLGGLGPVLRVVDIFSGRVPSLRDGSSRIASRH